MSSRKSKTDEKLLREKIEEQVAHERKAYKYVEKTVLSDSIERQEFKDLLNEIMPGHYSDIVEERCISKQCGYPLCSNVLSKVPKQKFHISVERKQIYDITERKCFCSSQCYKNSKYVTSQIPTSPLWMRKQKIEIEFLEDKLQKEQMQAEQRITENSNEKPEETPPSVSVENGHQTIIEEKPNATGVEPHSKPDHEGPTLSHVNQPETANPSSKPKKSCLKLIDLPGNPLEKNEDIDSDKLCNLMQQWCTVDTYEYFKVKNNKSNGCGEPLAVTEPAEQEYSFERKKRLAKKFLQENKEWEQEVQDTQPVVLKAFVSPLIDSKSQQTIRRRIVSEKLKYSFSEVFSELCLSFADFKVDLSSIIKTFKFTNQNITLRPKEWKVMATALLHMVSLQEQSLKESMAVRSRELEAILKSCGIDRDRLMELVDILKKSTQNSEKHADLDSGKDSNDVDYDNEALD